ncbi:hypothetical protein BaRGS_00027948 [Batillaria attramentaria]|uniref:RING-type domain-containing protein n=1 Tax=Batillaria attramentaria TaxID=370345 RepID=A0ABD0K1P3_9CAEN
MAAQTNARHGKPSSTQMSSLPITCQICLGKVKQPVLCPNCHVFCGPCMNIWLERNQKCPACRVPIDDGNPVKHIRGGLNQQEDEQIPAPSVALSCAKSALTFCTKTMRRHWRGYRGR